MPTNHFDNLLQCYVTVTLVEEARSFASSYTARTSDHESPYLTGVLSEITKHGILLQNLNLGFISWLDDIKLVEEGKMHPREVEVKHYETIFIPWHSIVAIN